MTDEPTTQDTSKENEQEQEPSVETETPNPGYNQDNEPLTKPIEDELETGKSDTDSEVDSEKESKEEKASEESSPEKKEETFYNAQNVPKELEPTYKGMQAAFTKKMQELSGSAEKANLYEKLMENPRFRSIMEGKPEETPATPIEEKYKGKSAHEIVQAMVEETVETKMKENVEPVTSQFYEKQAEDEISKLEQKYPDNNELNLPSFHSLRESIAERVEKYPDVPLEEHYKVIAFEKAQESGRQQAVQKMEEKKQGSAETGSAPEGVTAETPEVKNFWDAAKYALKKHR